MEVGEFLIVSILFFVVAAVYSSVGHAGASGYAAVLAFFSFAPEIMRPTSLILNIVVGSLGLYRFYRAGLIDFKKVLPFLVTSTPAAFFSGSLNVDKRVFFVLLGLLLLFSGGRLLFRAGKALKEEDSLRRIHLPVALGAGGLIGFFSGMTGTGGAIFFTPLLLGARWAHPREASGLSVAFVLANSIFGLAGIWKGVSGVPYQMVAQWGAIVLIGAIVGTYLGISRLPEAKLKQVLGFVLLIASVKLLGRGIG